MSVNEFAIIVTYCNDHSEICMPVTAISVRPLFPIACASGGLLKELLTFTQRKLVAKGGVILRSSQREWGRGRVGVERDLVSYTHTLSLSLYLDSWCKDQDTPGEKAMTRRAQLRARMRKA